jgi:hypothetical protein
MKEKKSSLIYNQVNYLCTYGISFRGKLTIIIKGLKLTKKLLLW